jgi:uncharacterized protein YecE (DUF72 family)
MSARIYVGCAGWSISKMHSDRVGGDGTHLERYSGKLPCVEINPSFYRPHRRETYERWRGATPADFRFAVKMPKAITHTHRLQDCSELLSTFVQQIEGLEEKLGPCLVQLPPSLSLNLAVAGNFFALLRSYCTGTIVCEPRHASWFGQEADVLFLKHRVARVAADPALLPAAAEPGGWPGMAYFRLHGSPRMYYSPYDAGYLERLAEQLGQLSKMSEIWCVFDNTAAAAAMANALELAALLGRTN